MYTQFSIRMYHYCFVHNIVTNIVDSKILWEHIITLHYIILYFHEFQPTLQFNYKHIKCYLQFPIIHIYTCILLSIFETFNNVITGTKYYFVKILSCNFLNSMILYQYIAGIVQVWKTPKYVCLILKYTFNNQI